MSIISVKNLSKIYRIATPQKGAFVEVRAVDNVSLTIEHGEFVAIVGPSGSGKSTLMQILGLLDRPTSGQYSFFGQDVANLPENELAFLRSQYIGFVFQFLNLLPRTSALDNIKLPLVYARNRHDFGRASQLLSRFELSDRANHVPQQLSGGQQQRVAIARALANNPKIVFADEPTGNVNQAQSKIIMDHLTNLNATGVTIVVVTHSIEVASYAHRSITIVDGRLQSDKKTRPLNVPRSPPKTPKTIPSSILDVHLVKENIKMALRSLSLNKLRTGLTMLGVIIGVASVIAMIALGQGAQKAIEERLRSLGSNLLYVRPGSPKLGHVRREVGTYTRLSFQDVKAINELKAIGVPIEEVSAEVSGAVQIVYENRNWATRLSGVSANYAKLRDAKPKMGRFFTEKENTLKKRVCLIGKTVYDNLFEEGSNPIGTNIKINRMNFTVIGMLPTKGASPWRDQDDIVLIPVLTAMQRVLGRDYLNSIGVQIGDANAVDSSITAISQLLRKRHRLKKHQEDDFTIRNLAEIQEALTTTTQTMALLLGAIAAISLIVGGIGIMNIMLVSVKERTREIGLRKALGAKNGDVLFQFIVEAIVISLIGGMFGILFGIGISGFLTVFFDWSTTISSLAIGIAFLFSFLVGIVFGFWPAKQASVLSPVEALRYE